MSHLNAQELFVTLSRLRNAEFVRKVCSEPPVAPDWRVWIVRPSRRIRGCVYRRGHSSTRLVCPCQ